MRHSVAEKLWRESAAACGLYFGGFAFVLPCAQTSPAVAGNGDRNGLPDMLAAGSSLSQRISWCNNPLNLPS
jgi:hypothetical protein